MRNRLEIPLILIALLAATIAQELLPTLSSVPGKPPLLLATAIYFVLRHTFAAATTIALWAGWLCDTPNGMPLLCTASFIFVVYLVYRALQQILLDNALLQGSLMMVLAAPLHRTWLKMFGGIPFAEASPHWLLTTGTLMLVGLVTGLFVFLMCSLLEGATGMKVVVKEQDGAL